jgi:hypothetical protein
MMKKATLAVYEAFVLGQFLSDYPSKKSYNAILNLIQKESRQVLIWQPFEDRQPEDVIQYMENLKESLILEFIAREAV